MTLLFPSLIVAANVLAAAVYAYNGDLKLFIYWAAAAALNAAVTYL